MVPLSILLIIAVLPVILICLYVYSKDRDKEPMKLLLKLFLLGMVSCVLVLIISFLLEFLAPSLVKDVAKMNLLEVIFYSFVIVALVEEFFKWIMVYNFGYKSKYFDQLYDIVVYAVFVSLGFAFLENLIYILLEGSLKVGIIRALLAVPGHACDAVFMGYYLSLARIYKFKNKKISKKYTYLSILVPTILHGIYDFCLFANIPFLLLAFFSFIVMLYFFSINKLNTISKKNLKSNGYCSKCGAKLEGVYCSRCGSLEVK